MDGVRPSTDQKVGDSSSSERVTEAEDDRARLVSDLARNGGYQREPLSHVFPGQSGFLLVTAIPALRSQRTGYAFRGRPVTVELAARSVCHRVWGPDDTLRSNADRELEHP